MARPAVSEWEEIFGFSDDPTPGDTEILANLARNYRSVSDDAGDALPMLSGLESKEVGEGKSMDKLREKLGDLADQVRKLHSSYDQAAGALKTYTGQLREHQRKADDALDKGREAKTRLDSATSVVSAVTDAIGRLDDAPPPDGEEARHSARKAMSEQRSKQSSAQADLDGAQADLDAARMLAEDARELRESDASVAARKLDDARGESVDGYSLWEKIRDAFTQAIGIISAVLGVLAMLVPGLQGLGLALTIGALATGAVALGLTIGKMAETGEWDIAEIVLGIAGLAFGGGALLKGAKAIGSALKGVKAGSLKNVGGKIRVLFRGMNTRTCRGDPVDVASGEMVLTETDLELPGVLPLVVRRTHLSTYGYGGFFGPSWASTLDERLELDDRGRVLWAREDGSVLCFPELPPEGGEEAVWPEEGRLVPLTHAGTGPGGAPAYRVTDPGTGVVSLFENSPEDDGEWFRLVSWRDRNGNEVTVSREEDGTPTALDHSGGYHVDFASTGGRIDRMSLATPDGPVEVMSYGHDADGNLTRVVNSSGLPLVFTYDDRSRITAWRDRNDSTYRYVYDEADRVVETAGPEGHLSSRWTYDDTLRQTIYTDACGASTVYRLNSLHQVIAETDPLGHITRYVRDRRDNLLARTDALGHTTRYEYDERHNPTAIHLPDGSTSTAAYNALNLPVASTGHGGETWRQEFDERGNLISVTAPDGSSTSFTHHENGAIATSTGTAGASATYEVDGAGLPRAVTDSGGNRATVERDAFGRPVAVIDPLGLVTRSAWTVEGQLSKRITPDGRTEHLTWDGEGNCLRYTDPAGGITAFEYTHFDKIAARTDPDGVRHTFTYDPELRVARVLNPQGLAWDYTYDAAGNLVTESDFDEREVHYTRDALGRVVAHTTPSGEQITFTYNSVGELVSKDAAGVVTSFSYDAAGAMAGATSPVSTLALERDSTGRILSETVDGRTTRYTYNRMGLRTSRTTPSGVVTELAYGESGQRSTLTTGGHRMDFTHDLVGREIARAWGSAASSVQATTAWDPAGRPAGQGLVAQERALRARSYAYRGDDRLLSVTDRATGRHKEMELDPAGRPLTVTADGWTETYAYDRAGNQTHADWPEKAGRSEARGERTYTGTRVQGGGAVRYEYDAAGRTVLRQKRRLSREPETWRYEWDVEDRLTACVTPEGTLWRYTYDAMGRRTAKYRMAADGSVAEAVYFTWDGSRIAEQTNSVTGVTLTWEYDGHRPLTQLERKPRTRDAYDSRFFAIVSDLVGTPTELVDETGHIAWKSRTTLWGVTSRNSDAAATTPLRFPGQYEDPETGLHYNYFRHYDPETGRYTAPDPLGLAPAPNPVTYVGHPFTMSDPLGLAPCNEANPSWGGKVSWQKDALGRPSEMKAQVDSTMIGGKTNVSSSMKPPGWVDLRHRSHLLGANLGGTNKQADNFVSLHGYANSTVMRTYEGQLAKAVKAGAQVDYTVKPGYKGNNLEPSDITLNVSGGGFQFKDRDTGKFTNSVTFPNSPKP